MNRRNRPPRACKRGSVTKLLLLGAVACSTHAAPTDGVDASAPTAVVVASETANESASACLPPTTFGVDADPTNPGLQPQCTVTTDSQLVAVCQMAGATTVATTSAMPCWWADVNPTACPDGAQLEINFVPAADVTAMIDCAAGSN